MLKPSDAEIVKAWLADALRDGDPQGKTRAGLAAHCGVSSQAVTGWQTTGRITKSNLEKAVAYFGHGPRFSSESNPPAVLPVRVTLMNLANHLAQFDELTRQAITPLVDRLINHPDEAGTIAHRVERILAAEPHGEYLVSLEADRQREADERQAAATRAQTLKDRAGNADKGLQPLVKSGGRPNKRH